MRRTHNSKHHVRPSMSGLPSSDEMGPPRESTRGRISLDTSTSGRSSIDSFNANRRPTESPQDWFGNRTISGDIPELDPAVVHTDLRKQLWDADRERQRVHCIPLLLAFTILTHLPLPQSSKAKSFHYKSNWLLGHLFLKYNLWKRTSTNLSYYGMVLKEKMRGACPR